jgi:ketosteroid isomerase-like protein
MTTVRTSPEQLLELYKSSVTAKDQVAFMSIYAEDAVIFDAWEAWAYRGHREWAPVVKAWFESLGDETIKVSFDEVEVTTSNDLSIVHAFINYTSRSPSREAARSMDNRLTWTLSLRAGVWEVIHEHTSAPVNFDGGKIILKREAV